MFVLTMDEVEVLEIVVNNPWGQLIPVDFIAAHPEFFNHLGLHHQEMDEEDDFGFGAPAFVGAAPENILPLEQNQIDQAEALHLVFIRIGNIELRLTEITENLEPIQENVREIAAILSISWPQRLTQLLRGLLNLTVAATHRCKWYFSNFLRRRRD